MRRERWTEEDVRAAYDAGQRAASRELVLAVIGQGVADLQTAGGRELASAVHYFAELDGELERWHADVVGLEPAAIRRRARHVLEDRFGPWEAGDLWERCAEGDPMPRRRRACHGERKSA